MNILIIGSGGREHALVWKLRQSAQVKNIFVALGNAGTALVGENVPLDKTTDIIKLLKKHPVDLVIVGPDSYLAEGIVDLIQKENIPVFGPTKNASEIEWSKSFAKQFMKEEQIPTAEFKIFNKFNEAQRYLLDQKFPVVIKANGLALGKGVIIANNKEEGEKVLREMMIERIFGEAGSSVVIEEYLQGTEISIHAFCDGEHAVLFPASQDHKRIFDGDKGPNTGGMGTIAPVPGVTQQYLDEIKEKIVLPTLAGLKKRGRPFTGILFPGIMITDKGPKVIEFNARFGDPETQSYMRILESDLLYIMLACTKGELEQVNIKWSDKVACCVVCASGGYPGMYEKEKNIFGLDSMSDSDVIIFHAGTKNIQGQTITNGGRVLGVTAVGKNLKEALSKVYTEIKNISFDKMYYRKDIGTKALLLK